MNSQKPSLLKFLSVCILLLGCGLLGAQTDKQAALEAKRRALQQEIAQIEQLRAGIKKKEISILTQVEDLDQRINTRENLIQVTNQQANLLTRKINTNLDRITALREELENLKEDYGRMVLQSYKSKNQQSRIMFLLSSENFLQAYKRLQYMKQYAAYRKKQGDQIKERTALLQETNKQLIEQKAKKQALIAENRAARAQLRQEKQQQDALIAEVRKKESSFAQQIRQKQKEADRIDRQIEAIIKEAIAASNKKAGKETTSKTFALTAESRALASDFVANKGKLPWPVLKGRVIKGYGRQQHPTLPNITTFNSGVEIETTPGSKARAIFGGTVFRIQDLPGAASAIYIRHGNYISVYQNIRDLKVKVNDVVSLKQDLGTISVNPFSGKTILKFLVYKDSDRLNPSNWIFNM
ncbi:murein hydrolase activator EnvC family protein [Croceiramulus getboli]|nr:peptidoglycan DD-metalloendopeptidase family protein [Flavobacteriaceae bacterium YJPT1-3]